MVVVPAAGAARVDPATSGQNEVEHAPGPGEQGASRWRHARSTGTDRRGSPWIVLVLWALLALPLIVALAVLRTRHWVPIGDIAQTELRVRDVWSRHPPVIGLAGRIGPFAHQGSHPGPLSFWALWPVYRLFGATPMGLVASGTFLQLLATGGALWLAFRRGGVRLAVGAALVLALLLRSYGSVTLTEPWNPYLPVMWWFLFLVAVWSVLCEDMVAFPVAVFAGTFCMQTHISYLGLVGGLTVVLLVGLVRALLRRRAASTERIEDQHESRRHTWAWAISGIVLGIVLWIPPAIEQLTTKPGNGTVIWRHFTKPPEAAVGLGKGIELLLVPLNPWWWINGQQHVRGSVIPGLVVLVVWLASAFAAWRIRHRTLLRLHIVITVALVLGLLSAAKIFGPLFNYLVLWDWGIGGLVFLGLGWTVAALVGSRTDEPLRDRARMSATAGMLAATVLVAGVFTAHAASTEFRAERPSEILRRVVGPTTDALASGKVPGGGRRGRYLVTWTDPIAIGTQGFGLLSELDRRGFHVGAEEIHGPGVTPHRVLKPGQFTAVVHLSVGQDIAVWRAKPGVRQVAYVDLRSRPQRAEYDRLRLLVIADLKAAHLDDQVQVVDGNLYGESLNASLNRDLPKRTFRNMVRMLDLGLPTAVFVGPPSSNG